MPELNDYELLAEFARTESETAFATLVARYVNLVYSTALRFTGNPHHAEEITQAVFIILARKAGKLSSGVVLSGWLYQAARLTAANLVKGEIRRHHREQEAYMQTILNESDEMTWKQIAPLLDDAMGGLGETDRNAIVLRFFENKTAAEVAAALKLTETAAHKRVNRALKKLRKFFTKRGVSSTTATLAGAISANSVQAAPVALVKTISAVAVAKGSIAMASTLTLVKGTLNLMAWTKAKMAIVAGAIVLLAAGTASLAINEIGAHNELTANEGIPPFTAEGLVSTEVRRIPLNTNSVLNSDGKFLFSYSNGIWQIQFTYLHQDYPPQLSFLAGRLPAMTDDKRIPDGIREIIFPDKTNSVTADGRRISPSSIVRSDKFPSIGSHELFLPWLSLCPNPELPLVSSNLIHFIFQPELLDNPKNEGGFKESYIGPENQFLSELVASNNGTMFLSDGTTMDYSEPALANGFVEFSYKVLETTNCQGIIFPLNAVLYQYIPLQSGKSPEDLWPEIITKLSIEQIDIGGHKLSLKPVPARVVALDQRLGLKNGLTMNYDVTNDQYYSLTNSRMEQLADFYRHHVVNKAGGK